MTERKSKYNAKTADIDGYHLDSQAELRRYLDLCLLLGEGTISELRVHPRFELQPGFRKDGIYIRPIIYEADFQYQDNETGAVIVEEIKGFETATWKLKEKMFLYRYPGTQLKVIK